MQNQDAVAAAAFYICLVGTVLVGLIAYLCVRHNRLIDQINEAEERAHKAQAQLDALCDEMDITEPKPRFRPRLVWSKDKT